MRKWLPFSGVRDQNAWYSIGNMIPLDRGGYITANLFKAAGTAGAGPGTPGTTISAHAAQLVSGTVAAHVGTTTKLYSVTDINTGTFSDKSKGGGYTSSATDWCFGQFGNITIANNYVDAVQSRDASGAASFADLAGTPPKAKIAVVQSNVVLLFNYNDGVNTYQDGWWASDVGDHTTWTPASSNDAANGRIFQTPGPITAAAAFRDEVIVAKGSGIFSMRYAGAPIYWQVTLIAAGIGVQSRHNMCVAGDFVVFNSDSAAYIYDGSRFRQIDNGVDRTGRTAIAQTYPKGAMYSPVDKAVVFAGWNYNQNIVYSLSFDAWGQFLSQKTTGTTYLDSQLPTYVPITGSPEAIRQLNTSSLGLYFGGMYLVDLSLNPCVVRNSETSNGVLYATSSLNGSFYGFDDHLTNVTRVIPVFNSDYAFTSGLAVGECQLTLFKFKNTLEGSAGWSGSGTSATAYASDDQFRFDVNITARFLQPVLSFTAGNACIEDIIFVGKPAGTD